jgi:uncharacterized protein (DUF2141 family)
MKKFMVLVLAFFVLNSLSYASESNIKIVVKGIKKKTGIMFISLNNSKEDYEKFKNKEPYKGIKKPVEDILLTDYFKDVPYGEYAIRIFHDVNSNGKLDANFLGVPEEPYGFSNNAKGFIGPPTFKYAKFIIDTANVTVTINLN